MKTNHFLTIFMLCFTAGIFQTMDINASNGVRFNSAISAFQPEQKRSPEEMAKHETNWMNKELGLTPAQLPKVDSINLVYANKLTVLREQSKGNRQEFRSRRAELDVQKRSDLALILTPDQLKKYDDALVARRQKMQNRQGNM